MKLRAGFGAGGMCSDCPPNDVLSGQSCFVCRAHLHAAELKAVEDQENAKKRFRHWVKTKVPDAEYMNICSGPQVSFPACSG
jgi:hypothetical protein